MKVAIIGTRGIPNNYGGFEQLAEYLSVMLVEKGCEVYVYNSSLHPYQEQSYRGVHLVHCFDSENKIGTAGQFIYDLNCILHARKKSYDIILQLGYTSSSIWSFLFPKKATIITNMDGLEWKRSKYGRLTQLFLKQAERWAVQYSDVLVADSLGIQAYLKKRHNVSAHYIPYGAHLFGHPSADSLMPHNIQANRYYLVIARLEPENNIETIIKGYLLSKSDDPLLIIGSTQTPFGRYLKTTYTSSSVLFKEAIYDISILNNLRYHAALYFHGHSVGGTNPSLLEAMASGAFICAHQNIFNASILQEDSRYFNNEQEVATIIQQTIDAKEKQEAIQNNYQKIATTYTWQNIANAYYQLMTNR